MGDSIKFNNQISLPEDPTSSNEAATKNYVDSNFESAWTQLTWATDEDSEVLANKSVLTYTANPAAIEPSITDSSFEIGVVKFSTGLTPPAVTLPCLVAGDDVTNGLLCPQRYKDYTIYITKNGDNKTGFVFGTSNLVREEIVPPRFVGQEKTVDLESGKWIYDDEIPSYYCIFDNNSNFYGQCRVSFIAGAHHNNESYEVFGLNQYGAGIYGIGFDCNNGILTVEKGIHYDIIFTKDKASDSVIFAFVTEYGKNVTESDGDYAKIIAPLFQDNLAYSVGDTVIYNGMIFVCKSDIGITNIALNEYEEEDEDNPIYSNGGWDYTKWQRSKLPTLNENGIIKDEFLPDCCHWNRKVIPSGGHGLVGYVDSYTHNVYEKASWYRANTPIKGPAIIQIPGGGNYSNFNDYVASWAGDDVYNGVFLNKSGRDYIIYLLPEVDHTGSGYMYFGFGITNKWHAFVHRITSESVTSSTSTTPTITFNGTPSEGKYSYTNPLTSLTLVWELIELMQIYGGVDVSLDFTAGTGFTATGFGDFTMSGLHCNNGVFSPVEGTHYAIKLTANSGKRNAVGTVSLFGVDHIEPLLDGVGKLKQDLIPKEYEIDDIVAPYFSTSSVYSVRDLVIKDGLLYRCISAVTTAGEWNASNWEQVTLSSSTPILDQSGKVKSDVLPLATSSNVGGVSVGNGLLVSNGKVSLGSHGHAATDISSGTISSSRLPYATTSQLGAVKVGSGLSVYNGLVSTAFSITDLIAAQYSTSKIYNIGDVVIYNNKLYRRIVEMTAAESWSSAKWEKVSISDAVPLLNPNNQLSPEYYPALSSWTTYSSTQTSVTLSLINKTKTTYVNALTSLNITANDLVESAIVYFMSGSTATTFSITGAAMIGNHCANGNLYPETGYSYVIRFSRSNTGKLVGVVEAELTLTDSTSSATTDSVTIQPNYHYIYENALESLSLTWTDFTSGWVKIDFTAGENMAISGLGDLTMTGIDCENGVFTPVEGRAYSLIFRYDQTTPDSESHLQSEVVIDTLIVVSAPHGSTVTCTNGNKTLTAISDEGYAYFKPDEEGEWTLSASINGHYCDADCVVSYTFSTNAAAILRFSDIKVMGARFNKNSDSYLLERLGDAEGLAFQGEIQNENDDGSYYTSRIGYSDFDDMPVYKDIKVCNLLNGVVQYYEGEEGFSYTCEHGIRIVVTANESNANEFDVAVYYNGVLVSSQTTNDNGLGNTLANVVCGTRTLVWYAGRTTALAAGTYDFIGGDDNNYGTVSVNSETFATVNTYGTWCNYTEGGDVMVEIPKFYMNIIDSDDYITYWISNERCAGFWTSPAHIDRGDGQGERDKIYVSRYFVDSAYRSRSSQEPKTGGDGLRTYRTGIQNRGAGYHVTDYTVVTTIIYLWTVEIASYYIYSLGNNCGYPINNLNVRVTGELDTLAFHSGTFNAIPDDRNAVYFSNGSVRLLGAETMYRGIENIPGGGRAYIEGLLSLWAKLFICVNPVNYGNYAVQDDSVSNYFELDHELFENYSYTVAQSGFVGGSYSEFSFDSTYPWAMVGTSLGGSSNKKYCVSSSRIYFSTTNAYSIFWEGNNGGLNSTSSLFEFSTQTYNKMCARMMYLPQNS